AVDAFDAAARLVVRDHLRAGCRYDRGVSAGVVEVLVRVQDLRDLPAALLRGGEALRVVERVDRQRLARLRACDQVVEVAVGIRRPDALDDHRASLLVRSTAPPCRGRARPPESATNRRVPRRFRLRASAIPYIPRLSRCTASCERARTVSESHIQAQNGGNPDGRIKSTRAAHASNAL